MAEIVVESFGRNALPAPGTAGRIVRLTDHPVRLWMDDGTAWHPALEDVANVLAYRASGDTDDTLAIQRALDTKQRVYLPRGVYRISDTVRFYDAQTIFGDAKFGSQIFVSKDVAAMRSATHPVGTRDVVIRDLVIEGSTKTRAEGVVGIDFTGVGFSRIERVGLRIHHTGIVGRDSTVFSTTLRTDSAGTALPVVSYQLFAVGQRVSVAGGGNAIPHATIAALAAQDDPHYPALILDKDPGVVFPAGSRVDPDPNGGYYNSVVDCEISGCRRGISLTHAANAWTVLDGRINGNDAGVYVSGSNGDRIRGTFEHNGVGVLFDGCSDCVVLAGSYFEANGVPSEWQNGEFGALGAVRCRNGAFGNVIEPASFGDGTDTVVDETVSEPVDNARGGRPRFASNLCTDPNPVTFPAMASGVGDGRNLLFNGDFAVESAAGPTDKEHHGLAAGWTLPAGNPGTFTLKVDTEPGHLPVGAGAALQWGMAGGDNSLRRLTRVIAVTAGQWYTFTGLSKVDPNGAGLYRLMIAESLNPTTQQVYYNSGGMPAHDYASGMHRGTFLIRPGVIQIYLMIQNLNTQKAGHPALCHTPGPCNAWFAKFHLEAGRGMPTESRDSGLMGEVRTGSNAPLTILQNGTPTGYIQVTHAYHAVSGSTVAITNIYPPAGFSGMVVLRATGAWSTVTSGSGPGRIGNAFTMHEGRVAIGWYDGDSETWWFTISADSTT